MEMKNRNVNHARNVLDRATTLLPRMDQFWYKYTYMEETLGDVPKARNVFERWMKWEPKENAWQAYIKMELRYDEKHRARAVYERFVSIHPEPANWIKWARFEEEHNNLGKYIQLAVLYPCFNTLCFLLEKCREIYTAALEFLGEEKIDQKVLVAFAKFEMKAKEVKIRKKINSFIYFKNNSHSKYISLNVLVSSLNMD
jgi:crooked neck